MPVEINITDEQIAYSEDCLIKGKTFDDERKEFIKNLETIDLQAVPGSGKTTVLLAKLVLLEKELPFRDGSGILVLSHTNAAVDEIKKEIQKYCPKLFSYPNFIGTIQGFVDEFLAVPYYTQCYKRKPFRIDNEIYDERVKMYYENLNEYSHVKNWLKNLHEPLKILQKIRFDENASLIPEFNKTEADFPLKNKQKHTYIGIRKMKLSLMEWGYLHFDDAYLLANRYLQKFPKIKEILQKRFQFIFVDEMQDMGKHQSKLLESLFYDNGSSISKYQRIGDKNQAIYDGKAEVQDFWEERNVKQITGSLRLSPPIANVVRNFALTPIEVVGLVVLGGNFPTEDISDKVSQRYGKDEYKSKAA